MPTAHASRFPLASSQTRVQVTTMSSCRRRPWSIHSGSSTAPMTLPAWPFLDYRVFPFFIMLPWTHAQRGNFLLVFLLAPHPCVHLGHPSTTLEPWPGLAPMYRRGKTTGLTTKWLWPPRAAAMVAMHVRAVPIERLRRLGKS